jgi:hypothetical protein
MRPEIIQHQAQRFGMWGVRRGEQSPGFSGSRSPAHAVDPSRAQRPAAHDTCLGVRTRSRACGLCQALPARAHAHQPAVDKAFHQSKSPAAPDHTAQRTRPRYVPCAR